MTTLNFFRADKLALGLTVEDAALLSRHLASSRSFSRAFDCYLSYILRVRDESAVALRTRAIKCLAEVVAVDPSIMERVSSKFWCFCDNDVKICVNFCK